MRNQPFVYLVCYLVTKRNTKRVQVSFTERQWQLIERLKGEMGGTYSEIVRNIVIAWLSEKSFVSTAVKAKMNFPDADSQLKRA